MRVIHKMHYNCGQSKYFVEYAPSRAGVAQLVEQLICNQPVVGSNPIASSMFLRCIPNT